VGLSERTIRRCAHRPIQTEKRQLSVFLASDRLSGSNPQKMRFCPDRRPSRQNSEDRADSRLETRIALYAGNVKILWQAGHEWD
jgi:hypothetical protein